MLNNYNDNQVDETVFEQANQPGARRQLDKGQKIAVAVLAFFALLIMVIWVVDTKKSLSGGTKYSGSSNQNETCPDGNCQDSSNTNDRLKDTDKDGLNDYDELNVYNTSPYIEDSDSDGYSDKQEVQNQNDPNCPFGEQCTESQAEAESQTQSASQMQSLENITKTQGEVENDLLNKSNAQVSNTEDVIGDSQNVLNGQGDPASIRQMLIQAGMDPEVLKQISDEELMSSYKEIIGG